MAKKQNGRELLRIDNDSYRRDNALCREILAKERAEVERLRNGIDYVLYLLTNEDTHDANVVSEIYGELLKVHEGRKE